MLVWNASHCSFFLLSEWDPFARAFGVIIEFNAVLVLFPMMRTLLRWICDKSAAVSAQSSVERVLRAFFDFIPFDRFTFHATVSVVMLVAVLVHTCAHFVNYIEEPENCKHKFGLWPYISGQRSLPFFVTRVCPYGPSWCSFTVSACPLFCLDSVTLPFLVTLLLTGR